jgi:RND superfamily putative drug exporter
LVSLFGRWNWWLPAWAARPLRVEPHGAIVEGASVIDEAEASVR